MVSSELWLERPKDVLDPVLERWKDISVVGRPGTVEEAAGAAAFLLDNGNMTGQTIYFDGGYTVM
jgi:NAD(P)-dependent dehydrogenase (short-subunit alcohol dehydrogenase family)